MLQELAKAVAAELGLTQARALEVVHAVCEEITKGLLADGRVHVGEFGIFEVRTRRARMHRHPRTDAPIPVPARKVPAFRPGKHLKNRVDARARSDG
jgi:DNA-binding protein HU-beta